MPVKGGSVYSRTHTDVSKDDQIYIRTSMACIFLVFHYMLIEITERPVEAVCQEKDCSVILLLPAVDVWSSGFI